MGSTPITEVAGCALLKRVFEARGYKINENVRFYEADVSFDADGWDPVHRVGYEYITSGGDHDDLTPEEMATLGQWRAEGNLAFFLIDNADVRGAAELEWAADQFLDEVAALHGQK